RNPYTNKNYRHIHICHSNYYSNINCNRFGDCFFYSSIANLHVPSSLFVKIRMPNRQSYIDMFYYTSSQCSSKICCNCTITSIGVDPPLSCLSNIVMILPSFNIAMVGDDGGYPLTYVPACAVAYLCWPDKPVT